MKFRRVWGVFPKGATKASVARLVRRLINTNAITILIVVHRPHSARLQK